MDPVALILPGAQSLVSQILSDGWVQVRSWLSRRLSSSENPEQTEIVRQLDIANEQADALPIPESGVSAETAHRLVLEAYWAGYLAALAGSHPELTTMLAEFAERGATASPTSAPVNSVSGTVSGHVVQAEHIDGGVRFS
jgi:hypothetical protein